MIRWVFLDVGNVVMNVDPVMAFIYGELHDAIKAAGIDKSFEALLEEREEAIRQQGPGHWYLLGERYLGTDGLHRLMHHCAARIRTDYMAYHNILPGMREALERLSEEFTLGRLANQLREVADAFEAGGLRRYFRVLAVSELVGLKTPAPALFRWALQQADCRPEEAIMVGDRIDNDVVPARNLGIWTIWFHAPLEEKGYTPVEERARLYFESQKRESISRIGPARPDEEPDGEATSAAELVGEALRLQILSRTSEPLGSPPARRD